MFKGIWARHFITTRFCINTNKRDVIDCCNNSQPTKAIITCWWVKQNTKWWSLWGEHGVRTHWSGYITAVESWDTAPLVWDTCITSLIEFDTTHFISMMPKLWLACLSLSLGYDSMSLVRYHGSRAHQSTVPWWYAILYVRCEIPTFPAPAFIRTRPGTVLYLLIMSARRAVNPCHRICRDEHLGHYHSQQ